MDKNDQIESQDDDINDITDDVTSAEQEAINDVTAEVSSGGGSVKSSVSWMRILVISAIVIVHTRQQQSLRI